MGGFLQSIINGYGGIRLYPERMEFHKPYFLPNSQGLKFIGEYVYKILLYVLICMHECWRIVYETL